MFAPIEINYFESDYFNIHREETMFIEVQSKNTKQFWLIMKFKKNNYPKIVLYHKHDLDSNYHVHFCFHEDNILLSLLEIQKHDKYILDRRKKRGLLGTVSSNQLLRALQPLI